MFVKEWLPAFHELGNLIEIVEYLFGFKPETHRQEFEQLPI
jgi:hypothetical protein